jgi:5-methylcytosine-specific restriction enzyme subunit McrC
MSLRKVPLQVFEHQSIHYGRDGETSVFKQSHFNALVKLNELHDNQYFTIIHKGIKFKQFVGVIQVDGLTIEILPKIDSNDNDKAKWQGALIEMLRVTRKLNVHKVGEAHITKQHIHLLDIYFEWFLNEVQLLIHQGLIKQYYKHSGNVKALKGKLEFGVHIQENLVHKERFYTTHQVYDKDHLVHQVLSKAMEIVAHFSKGNHLYARCKSVELDFPEAKNIDVNAATFDRIPNNRKTAPYETALKIARLIVLNYAPNVSSGKEHMLALLFDMNSLWEEYILVRLKQANSGCEIYGQQSKGFWNGISIRPDIIIKKGDEYFVIDTKWKNIGNGKPSTDDLRQLYVYNEYWQSKKSVLLYPSNEVSLNESNFIPFEQFEKINSVSKSKEKSNLHHCGLGKISIFNSGTITLNKNIGNQIINWFS